jgi:DNA-binding NarL/FixJ family response regulator
MDPYRIVLADDHLMLRHGIKRILADERDLEVVGEVSDGLELLDLLKNLSPDLVILDISMPNLRGIEATREIKMIRPKVKVLILTMHNDKDYLYYAIRAGAEGYLLKEDADTELFSAITAIRRGRTYISPILTEQLTDELAQLWRGARETPLEYLTTREKEVLKLVAEGKSNRQIADLLCISVRTVEHHRANMMNKLGLRKTADLIRYAIRKGYTSTSA